jgi:hypothetical protein
MWAFEDDLDDLRSPEEHLERLLELIKPRKAKIKTITSKYQAQVCIEGYHEAFHVQMYIKQEILQQLADLHADFNPDIYVLTIKPDEPFRRAYFSEAVGLGSSDELLFKPKTALKILQGADRAKLVLRALQFWKDTLGQSRSEVLWHNYLKNEYTQDEAFEDAITMLKSPLPHGAKYVSIWLREKSKEQHHAPHLHDLGAEGIAWTLSQLDQGLDISARLLKAQQLEYGKALLTVATDEHYKAAHNLKPVKSGVTTNHIIDTTEQAAVLLKPLRELSQQYGPLTIITENNLASPGDRIVRNPGDFLIGTMYKYEGHIFHRLAIDRPMSKDRLDKFFRWSSDGYPLNAFIVPTSVLGSYPAANDLPELSSEVLDNISKSTKAIINSAYDGEAYSIWLPAESESHVK